MAEVAHGALLMQGDLMQSEYERFGVVTSLVLAVVTAIMAVEAILQLQLERHQAEVARFAQTTANVSIPSMWQRFDSAFVVQRYRQPQDFGSAHRSATTVKHLQLYQRSDHEAKK